MRTLYCCFSLSLAAAISVAATAFAQMPAYDQAGPIPSAITAAKTVFISNAGSDSGLFPSPFTGDPDRPYAEFYSALKATGDYTLAGDPAQAELVLELRLFAPDGPTNPNNVAGASDPLPMFRLVMYPLHPLGHNPIRRACCGAKGSRQELRHGADRCPQPILENRGQTTRRGTLDLRPPDENLPVPPSIRPIFGRMGGIARPRKRPRSFCRLIPSVC
jgi:hypothetical protein